MRICGSNGYDASCRRVSCAVIASWSLLPENLCRWPVVAVRRSSCRWTKRICRFKSRGFGWEKTHLEQADRLDKMLLIMALALHWCVRIGRQDQLECPTPLEKKAQEQTSDEHWSVKKMLRSRLSWFNRGLRKLYRLVESGLPLPAFSASPYHLCRKAAQLPQASMT